MLHIVRLCLESLFSWTVEDTDLFYQEMRDLF